MKIYIPLRRRKFSKKENIPRPFPSKVSQKEEKLNTKSIETKATLQRIIKIVFRPNSLGGQAVSLPPHGFRTTAIAERQNVKIIPNFRGLCIA